MYFGKEPPAKRINDFFKLKGIALRTLSQFLVAFDSKKYPFVTSETIDALNLDPEQEKAARDEAIHKYKIEDPTKYFERTIDLLSYMVVFREIKSKTGVKDFEQIHKMIWYGAVQPAEGFGEQAPGASLLFENDLRDYLAEDPSRIETGLTLVKKEYDAKDAGKIDLLCKDKAGNTVVVELKRGHPSDQVVGQILRYMGWLEENKGIKNLRGIVIAHEPDERLRYALVKAKKLNVKIKYYEIKFKISDS